MTLLLTGSTGLIGKQFLKQIGTNEEVITISKQGQGKNNLALDLSEQIETKFLPGSCDTVVHFAQSPYYKEFPNKGLDVFNVNVSATQMLLDFSIQSEVSKFVLASSGGVYGTGDKAFSETDPIYYQETRGHYLASKLCMELLAKAYSSYMDVIILRFFFVYGARQKRTMLVPKLVDSVMNGDSIKLQGQNGIKINPIHVEDAANSVASALKLTGSHTVNIAGKDVYSLREIANIIGNAIDKKPFFEIDHSVQPKHLLGDISRMTSLLTAPKIRFEDGVKTMIDS